MEMRPTRQLTGKRCEAGQKARPSHCHMLLLGDPLQNTKPAAEGEEGREGPVPGTHHAQGGDGAEPGKGAGLKAGGSDNRANGDYSITTSLHNDGRHYPASKYIKQTTAELSQKWEGLRHSRRSLSVLGTGQAECLASTRVWKTRPTTVTFPGHASEQPHTRHSRVVIQPSWQVPGWGKREFPPALATGDRHRTCLTQSSRRSESPREAVGGGERSSEAPRRSRDLGEAKVAGMRRGAPRPAGSRNTGLHQEHCRPDAHGGSSTQGL